LEDLLVPVLVDRLMRVLSKICGISILRMQLSVGWYWRFKMVASVLR